MNRSSSRQPEKAVVAMVGTSMSTMGGISTVVKGYSEAGLFDRAPVVYVATHGDGSAVRKLLLAAKGYWTFLRLLATRTVAAVHVHLSSRASFWRKLPVFALARVLRKPFLLHLHGSEFMVFFDDECGPLGKRIVRSVFDAADLIMVLSPQWAENVRRITDNPNVTVLYNGVPVEEKLPDRVRRDGPPAILFLGRLGRRKGIYDLLEALARLGRDGVDFRLIAAGDGETDLVGQKAAELGLGPKVRVPGWIGDEDKPTLLRDADIFVLPSHAEGLPMSVLEAMAAGLPILCTSVGGLPSAVSNESEGLVVPPGDVAALSSALHRLLSDPQLRARLGRNAHERARSDFDVRISVDRLVELYRGYVHSPHQSRERTS